MVIENLAIWHLKLHFQYPIKPNLGTQENSAYLIILCLNYDN